MSKSSPGVASQYSAKALPGAFECAIHSNGVDEILRALRGETATAERAAEKVKRCGNHYLVDANEKYEDRFHFLQSVAVCIKPDSWSIHFHSFSNCSELASAARNRAMTTSRNPGRIRSPVRWMIPRMRRLTRFRTTAPPIFFVVISPSLNGSLKLLSARKPSTRNFPRIDLPSLRTRRNSDLDRILRVRGIFMAPGPVVSPKLADNNTDRHFSP